MSNSLKKPLNSVLKKLPTVNISRWILTCRRSITQARTRKEFPGLTRIMTATHRFSPTSEFMAICSTVNCAPAVKQQQGRAGVYPAMP